jgi:hypothetical protein
MNRTVASNTGPLIAFANAGLLDIPARLFHRIVVPEAVAIEIDAGAETSIRFDVIRKEIPQIETIPSISVDPLLAAILDQGEASVIQLSIDMRPDFTLIDERKGRKIAADIYHLKVIGTAGILLMAKKHGIIESISQPIKSIIKSGYYIHDKIVDAVLRAADE